MDFKYAFADFAFPLVEHDSVIKLIGILGYDGIDIGIFHDRSHLQPADQFAAPEKNGRILGKKAADAGLKVADVFLQLDLSFDKKAINHPDTEIRKFAREQYLMFIDYAKAAGSEHITCLPGCDFGNYGEAFKRMCEELSWRVEKAKEMGLILGVEATMDSIADSPEKAIKMVGAVEGLTLTLDYCHFVKAGYPDTACDMLMPYASHFHAHGCRKGLLQAVMAENEIDYTRVAHLMKQTGYKGYVGVEYIWTDWENSNRSDNVAEGYLMRDVFRNA